MTGLQKLLDKLKGLGRKVGKFFTDLFNKMEEGWESLEPKVQEALKQASDVINTLNVYVDETPDFVIEMLQKKWPELTRDQLLEYLRKTAHGTEIAGEIVNQDLETTIKAFQIWLGSLNGSGWANISEALAKAYAIAKAPKETKFAVISQFMFFVYHTFIKKG